MKRGELLSHQSDIIDKVRGRDFAGLWWEPGTGKTFACLKILESWGLPGAVIVAPKIVLDNWEDEIEKWGFSGRMDFYILNYEKFLSSRYYEEVEGLLSRGWGFVLDESHKIKNSKAKRTSRILKLSEIAKKRICLTGTPFLRSVQDLFSQALFLDRGRTWGRNFYIFRALYCFQTPDRAWRDRKRKLPEIRDKMSSFGSMVKRGDVLRDLPPKTSKKIYVEMEGDQLSAYRKMRNDSIVQFRDDLFQTAPNILAAAMRLQQIVSGHLPVTDLKDGHTEIVKFKSNKRLEVLKDLLRMLIERGEKVIVWTCFRADMSMIALGLKALGVPIFQIGGMHSQKERMKSVKGWKEAKDEAILIANRRACGIGINLVEAKSSVIYSRGYSLEDELQSEARNYRMGSQVHDEIVKYDLVTRKSIDERILSSLGSKRTIADELLEEFTTNVQVG